MKYLCYTIVYLLVSCPSSIWKRIWSFLQCDERFRVMADCTTATLLAVLLPSLMLSGSWIQETSSHQVLCVTWPSRRPISKIFKTFWIVPSMSLQHRTVLLALFIRTLCPVRDTYIGKSRSACSWRHRVGNVFSTMWLYFCRLISCCQYSLKSDVKLYEEGQVCGWTRWTSSFLLYHVLTWLWRGSFFNTILSISVDTYPAILILLYYIYLSLRLVTAISICIYWSLPNADLLGIGRSFDCYSSTFATSSLSSKAPPILSHDQ